MKCKQGKIKAPLTCDAGLIEAYWNVNALFTITIHGAVDGLIEAYWNVNTALDAEEPNEEYGLIEAYWNVNCN